MLVPLTQEQVDEAPLELCFDQVWLLNVDVERLKAALKEYNCRGKKRPTLAPVDFVPKCGAADQDITRQPSPSSQVRSTDASASSCGATTVELEGGEVEVEPV